MTTEELLALPDNGVDRWLIQGQLREKRSRPRDPARTLILDQDGRKALERIAGRISTWLEQCPPPRGKFVRGETGCRVDDGGTILLVDVPCSDDSYGELWERIDRHRKDGVAIVWLVRPFDRTITVYRLDAVPELFNIHHELTAEPHLPGFRLAVVEIFA